ncbi:MAG: glycosyltransferase [Leptolyngbyaceae cyanobacterium bins.302]|nr:glycosyltransferase [Leptolyngbyaceae cyanobacterium bins.302]
MKISVILPCYNGVQTIAVQLEALANQTYVGEWELIVANNGSTDNSMDIVESYRDRLPHLRIVDAYTSPGPRLPVAHSYNTGIKAATGDAFVFCEADDEVSPQWLAAMAEALANYPFVAGALRYDRLNPTWLFVAQSEWHQEHELVDSENPLGGFAYGCNIGIQRSLYETLGELDTSIPTAADKDYCWRAQQAGVKIHFVPAAIVQYRLRHTLESAYRQGKTWGKDQPLVYARYQIPLEKPIVLHRIIGLLRYLPKGIKLWLMSLLNIGRGKGGFVRWTWGLGFLIGELQGFFQHSKSKFASK